MGTNNGNVGKKGRSGRKGYGIENAKKAYLEKAFYIANKSLDKESDDLKEKEKIVESHRVAQKEIGKPFDFGDTNKIKKVLVEFIDGDNKDTN